MRMHGDEVGIDAALVKLLLSEQFPQWARLPVRPVGSAGTDNALYRLGDDMAVRLPRIEGAAAQVDKEQRWLPTLAPLLPVEVPVPLAKGEPGRGYPWRWSLCRWVEGQDATVAPVTDVREAAVSLGGFVAALHSVEASGGPAPGRHNSFRGEPLAARDDETRAAIAELRGLIDGDAATAVWEGALEAPAWEGPPIWLHGDLHAANLLVRGARLSGVIDFGCLGIGDPACDAMVAWTYLTAGTRPVFRDAIRADDATWDRGRGWALSFGLVALPYYRDTNPVLAGIARYAIEQAIADYQRPT
jgi:aminoglycoside phosphotransferase (APT) family kinase protein